MTARATASHAHEAAPESGTERSFLGMAADMANEFHYPVEAQCGCGEKVILVEPGATWQHAPDYYGVTA